jgi:hypothetical protein
LKNLNFSGIFSPKIFSKLFFFQNWLVWVIWLWGVRISYLCFCLIFGLVGLKPKKVIFSIFGLSRRFLKIWIQISIWHQILNKIQVQMTLILFMINEIIDQSSYSFEILIYLSFNKLYARHTNWCDN